MAAAMETAAMWLSANCTAEDAKLLAPLFAAQGINTGDDVLALTKEDLVELKVAIGPRNRFLEAQQKLKAPAPGPAPAPAPSPAKPAPNAAAPAGPHQWSCPACTSHNSVNALHCLLCGTMNPNAAPPAPKQPSAPVRVPIATNPKQPRIGRPTKKVAAGVGIQKSAVRAVPRALGAGGAAGDDGGAADDDDDADAGGRAPLPIVEKSIPIAAPMASLASVTTSS